MEDNASEKSLNYIYLDNKGDDRGESFSIPSEVFEFFGRLKDMHIAKIAPNKIRGNHYHIARKEFIVVVYEDSWSLGWDSGSKTKCQEKEFHGEGAVLIEVSSGASHAIKNTGDKTITIIACSDKSYNPKNSDTFRRDVLV